MSKIKANPAWNYMYLSCNKQETSKGGIILTGNDVILPKQVILKTGPTVREPYTVGMEVYVNPEPYMKRDWRKQDDPTLNEELHKNQLFIVWPIEEVDGVEVMVVPDNHIRHWWPKEDVVKSKFEV